MNFHNCIQSPIPVPMPGVGRVNVIPAKEVIPFSMEYCEHHPEDADHMLAMVDGAIERRLAAVRARPGGPWSLIAFEIEKPTLMPSPCFMDWPEEWSPKRYVAFLKGIIERLHQFSAAAYPGVPVTEYSHAMPSYWAFSGQPGHAMAAARWVHAQPLLKELRQSCPLPSVHIYLTPGVKAADYQRSLQEFVATEPGPKWAIWLMLQIDEADPLKPVPKEELQALIDMARRAGASDVVLFGNGYLRTPEQRKQAVMVLADQVSVVSTLIKASTPK